MLFVEAIDGKTVMEESLMEQWEHECNHTLAKEREANRIMERCPFCDYCGAPVDMYGVYGAKNYFEYGGDYYHKNCFPKWLYKHVGDAVDIAMELANEEYLKPVKEWRN